VRRRLQPR